MNAKMKSVLVVACVIASGGAMASQVVVRSPELPVGTKWTVIDVSRNVPRVTAPDSWERRTYWDLRPPVDSGRAIERAVMSPTAAGYSASAIPSGADRALCSFEKTSGRRLGCALFRAADTDAAGPRFLGSSVSGSTEQPPRLGRIEVGTRFRRDASDGAVVDSVGVAEGMVVVPGGPREAVLLREIVRGSDGPSLRYRFLSRSGLEVARLEGPLPAAGAPFRPTKEELLASSTAAASDPVQIPYENLHAALAPGATGFLQYSFVGTTTTPTTPLTSLDPDWTSVSAMISIDQTDVSYQPDPNDPSSTQVLPRVWDFTGLDTGTLSYRTFNTTRDDTAWDSCLESCSVKDQSATPPDGTWQGYLKIDTFNPNGTVYTRDMFLLNDNDTGADPSIDVPFVVFDELNAVDREQICFQGSAGGANRLLRFFKFIGASPSVAVMSVGDPPWTSGAWTNCTDGAGLRLTTASSCGDSCYPTCSGAAPPRARGMLDTTAGIGFRMTVLDEGYVHVPTGNYVPSLLLRQDTDIQAGVSLFGTCNIGTQRNRAFDYFWVNDAYGLLASVSSPTDDTGTLPPDDWSSVGNASDGSDFTWGPFPPWQTTAQACLTGTKISWALPADGSNLSGNPGVSNYGYVVSWGSQTDPNVLADWSTNPNHTPLPGETGYLAAPAGGEPTSSTITSWAGSAINATVVTALDYADPSAGDQRTYRSTAFYKVTADPARLDSGTFVVGASVAPFTSKNGSDIDLSWPPVAGAASYHIRVWDLSTGTEIPCPSGLDCHPTAPNATHVGGATDPTSYGYRVTAVDPCGGESSD